MVIKKLSIDIQNIIGSGSVISDVTQCVLELVYNALDARASSIAVRVNLRKLYVQVVDNGIGITAEDLASIGIRYMTCKCSRTEELENFIATFGYRGSSVASIASICESLEIQSRYQNANRSYNKKICGTELGEVLESKSLRPVQGTTVTVSNLFHTLPVRRKRIKQIFDLEDIRSQLQALATIYHGVSFSLRNDSTGKVILQTNRREDIKETLSDIYSLRNNVMLLPVKYISDETRVSGYVSRQLHTDSSLQLVYVNRRIVYKSKVHKLVIDLVKKYGNIWEDMSMEANDIVDVDGFVFIILLHVSYESFTLEKNGRANNVEFQNPKQVLKCVCRAVKRVFVSEALSDESQMSIELNPTHVKNAEKRNFGPSQLQNVVHGLQVGRPRAAAENSVLPVLAEENLAAPELSLMKSVESVVRYKEKFFDDGSKEGTALAENAPIYEVGDFSLTSFHDFLNWLSVKSKYDQCAQKLLTEYRAHKENLCVAKRKTAPVDPILVLKERRKEKFEIRSKMMMKKVQQEMKCKNDNADVNRKRNLKHHPSWTRVVRKKTVTVTATPHLTNNIPQAAFSEFLAWLKLKATHNNTVNRLMFDFVNFKKGSTIHAPLRDPTVTDHLRKTRGSIMKEQRPVERGDTGKRSLPDEVIPPAKVKKQKRKTCESAANQNKRDAVEDGELMLTWASHYFNRRDRQQNVVSTPAVEPILPHQHQFLMSQTDIPSPIKPSSGIEPQKTHGLQNKEVQVSLVIEPHIKFVPQDKEVQACPILKEVSTQVTCRKHTKNVFVQTETSNCDQDAQTDALAPPPSTSSSEIPLEKIIKSSSEELATVPAQVPEKWQQRLNHSNRRFFVHSPSGFTTFEPPASSTKTSFELKNVCENPPSVPMAGLHDDGLDELRAAVQDSCQDLLANVKWDDSKKAAESEVSNVEEVFQILSENVNTTGPQIPSAKIDKKDANVHALLNSFTFQKEDLDQMKVVGQLDKKFIVVIFNKQGKDGKNDLVICLFDQHAVDERINLEKLLTEYSESDSEKLENPLNISVPASTMSVIKSQMAQFEKHGLFLALREPTTLVVSAVPACLLRKQEREEKAYRASSLKRMVTDLLIEIADHLKRTRGAGLSIPNTIIKVVATEACRSAIKFNHALSDDEMRRMLNDLAQCNLPFQCAHGRPSLIPLYQPQPPAPFWGAPKKLNFAKFQKS